MNRTPLLAAVAAGALLVPAAGAVAKNDHAAKGKAKVERVSKSKSKAGAKSKAKKVKTYTYEFKGVYQEGGSVLVSKGNGHVRRAGLVGKAVALDLSAARLVVADADGNGVTVEDVFAGDRVKVQVKAPRISDVAATLKARKLVDLSRPPVSDDDAPETEVETEHPVEAPHVEGPEQD